MLSRKLYLRSYLIEVYIFFYMGGVDVMWFLGINCVWLLAAYSMERFDNFHDGMGNVNISVEVIGKMPTCNTIYFKKMNASSTYPLKAVTLHFHFPGNECFSQLPIKDWIFSNLDEVGSQKQRGYFCTSVPHDVFFDLVDGKWQQFVSETGYFYLLQDGDVYKRYPDEIMHCLRCSYPDLTKKDKLKVKKLRYILNLNNDWAKSTYSIEALDQDDVSLGVYDSVAESRRKCK